MSTACMRLIDCTLTPDRAHVLLTDVKCSRCGSGRTLAELEAREYYQSLELLVRISFVGYNAVALHSDRFMD
jgi:hypothetical protein